MRNESLLPEKAKSIILSAVTPAGSETISFTETLGRYVYEDVTAPRPLPQFDNAAMDGYAVRSADLAVATPDSPVSLRVGEKIFAGKTPEQPLSSGECARIFTGARLPDNADAVVRQEDVIFRDGLAVFTAPVEKGLDIRRVGEDIAEGDLLLVRGSRICAASVGLLAALRITFVRVFRRPRICLLATGSELADVWSPYRSDRIVNSNTYALAAMVAEAGGEPVTGGIVEDDETAIGNALDGAADCDMVVTTGGVSVGEFDLVREALAGRGVEWLFRKVRIRPGQPTSFGVRNSTLFFGLPGNPVSAMVAFDQFVRPAVLAMCGVAEPHRPRIMVTLGTDLHKRDDRTHFLRARLQFENGELTVMPLRNQSSAAMSTMAGADCYVVLEEGRGTVRAGEKVPVEVFRSW